MTNAGTETAFRHDHCKHFQKSKHLLGSEVNWLDHQSVRKPDFGAKSGCCSQQSPCTLPVMAGMMKKTVEWWVLFVKSAKKGVVTSVSEDDSGEAVLDLFAELCFGRFYKSKGTVFELFLNFLFDEETDGSHILAHGALSGGAKRNRRSATRGEILYRHIKGMKRDLKVWPQGRHKMFVVPGPLRRSTKGRDPLQERTTHFSFSCPKCRLWLAQWYRSPQK